MPFISFATVFEGTFVFVVGQMVQGRTDGDRDGCKTNSNFMRQVATKKRLRWTPSARALAMNNFILFFCHRGPRADAPNRRDTIVFRFVFLCRCFIVSHKSTPLKDTAARATSAAATFILLPNGDTNIARQQRLQKRNQEA